MWSQAYASHMHALHYVIYKQDLDLQRARGPDNRFGFQQGPDQALSIYSV